MATSPLRRIYAFSDTYGRSKNPFIQDDADALISTDFRSFPLESIKREFDIYGREAVMSHVLRLIFQLHEEVEKARYMPKETKDAFAQTFTGIFINSAPRTTHENGAAFYVATGKNIRIVTTDPAGLSSIKDKIESLSHLPNDENEIYGTTEQFRSSYTAYLLHADHRLPLIKDSIDIIPDYPEDMWELSYVDRFGNLITHSKDPEAKWKELQKMSNGGKKPVLMLIGNTSQEVHIGVSLKDANPGDLVIYLNGDLEVLRKWEAGDDSYQRLRKSAFFQFAKPEIGSRVRAID